MDGPHTTTAVSPHAGLLENTRQRGAQLVRGLERLAGRFPIKDIRGKGLMIGLEFDEGVAPGESLHVLRLAPAACSDGAPDAVAGGAVSGWRMCAARLITLLLTCDRLTVVPLLLRRSLHPFSAGTASAVSNACLERDMLLLTTSAFEVIRFVPALVVTESEVDECLDIVEAAMTQVFA